MFKEYYQKAPEKIQNTVSSEETATSLGDIARENHVDIDGVANPIIGDLVGNILVGLLHPKEFVPSLKKELRIDHETAQNIAKEINEKVFSQVKDELIVLYNLDDSHPKKEEVSSLERSQKKDPYHTPADLFEKKLQHSILTQKKEAPSKTKTLTETGEGSVNDARANDTYREPVE